ncbi:MAG: hypothetical protein Q8R53_01570 [Nanoarchaeota archaeon]|nr:hypothetical protein [Nanoarchaeota archaeon]
MKHIPLLIIIIAIFLVLAACSQQASDGKVFWELEQLSDDDLEAVLTNLGEAITGRSTTLPSDVAGALATIRWERCSDSDGDAQGEQKNPLVKGAVRVNYSKQGFEKFMTYVDYCINTTSLREYFCEEEGQGYGRITVNCPVDRSCIAGACSK